MNTNQKWISIKETRPKPEIEVLVEVDGHRSPAWRNNHNLVAYMDRTGLFWEERHPSENPLPVLYWMPLPDPPKGE